MLLAFPLEPELAELPLELALPELLDVPLVADPLLPAPSLAVGGASFPVVPVLPVTTTDPLPLVADPLLPELLDAALPLVPLLLADELVLVGPPLVALLPDVVALPVTLTVPLVELELAPTPVDTPLVPLLPDDVEVSLVPELPELVALPDVEAPLLPELPLAEELD